MGTINLGSVPQSIVQNFGFTDGFGHGGILIVVLVHANLAGLSCKPTQLSVAGVQY
jgi:hypothetical protein